MIRLHRITEWLMLEGMSCPSTLLKQHYLEQAVQDYVPVNFECLKR